MQEQARYQMALMAAEAMYMLWELGQQEEERDLDAMMRRLKDLPAYSLTHAEILDLKEEVEILPCPEQALVVIGAAPANRCATLSALAQ